MAKFCFLKLVKTHGGSHATRHRRSKCSAHVSASATLTQRAQRDKYLAAEGTVKSVKRSTGREGGEEAWDTGRVLKARRLSFLDSCSVQMSTEVWPFSEIQSRSPRVLDICFFQMSTRLAGSPLERPSQLMGAPIWISWASCLHICVLQLSKTIGLPAGLCQPSPTRLPASFRQLLFPTV